MKNAVEVEFRKEKAEGGEGGLLFRVFGPGGKERDKIAARRNRRGNDIDAKKASGGIKKNGEDFRGGYFFGLEPLGTDHFPGCPGRTEIKIPGQSSPISAMETGSNHHFSQTGTGKGNDGSPTPKNSGRGMSSGRPTQGKAGVQFSPTRQQGFLGPGQNPGRPGGKRDTLISGGRPKRFHGWKMGRFNGVLGSNPFRMGSKSSEVICPETDPQHSSR